MLNANLTSDFFSPHYPSRLSQGTDFVVPCVIHKTPTDCFTYGNVYVPVLLFQVIPPFPSPTVSTSLMPASPFLLGK